MADANVCPMIPTDPILPAEMSLDNIRSSRTRSDQSGQRKSYVGCDPRQKRRKTLAIRGRGYDFNEPSLHEAAQHFGPRSEVPGRHDAPSSTSQVFPCPGYRFNASLTMGVHKVACKQQNINGCAPQIYPGWQRPKQHRHLPNQ
jgi:hypothetical protein